MKCVKLYHSDNRPRPYGGFAGSNREPRRPSYDYGYDYDYDPYRSHGRVSDHLERPYESYSGVRSPYRSPPRPREYTPPHRQGSLEFYRDRRDDGHYPFEYPSGPDYGEFELDRLTQSLSDYRESERFEGSPRTPSGRRAQLPPPLPPPLPPLPRPQPQPPSSRPLAERITGRLPVTPAQQRSQPRRRRRARQQHRPEPPRPQPVPGLPAGRMVMNPASRPEFAPAIPSDRNQIFCENCERRHDPRFYRGPLVRGVLRVCTRCGSRAHRFERCWWGPNTADIHDLDEHLWYPRQGLAPVETSIDLSHLQGVPGRHVRPVLSRQFARDQWNAERRQAHREGRRPYDEIDYGSLDPLEIEALRRPQDPSLVEYNRGPPPTQGRQQARPPAPQGQEQAADRPLFPPAGWVSTRPTSPTVKREGSAEEAESKPAIKVPSRSPSPKIKSEG